MTVTPAGEGRWTTRDRLLLALVVLGGIAIRVALLPSSGLTGDMTEFARWIHGIGRTACRAPTTRTSRSRR